VVDHVAEPEPSVEALLADMKAISERMRQTRALAPPITSSRMQEPSDIKQVALNMCGVLYIESGS